MTDNLYRLSPSGEATYRFDPDVRVVFDSCTVPVEPAGTHDAEPDMDYPIDSTELGWVVVAPVPGPGEYLIVPVERCEHGNIGPHRFKVAVNSGASWYPCPGSPTLRTTSDLCHCGEEQR